MGVLYNLLKSSTTRHLERVVAHNGDVAKVGTTTGCYLIQVRSPRERPFVLEKLRAAGYGECRIELDERPHIIHLWVPNTRFPPF